MPFVKVSSWPLVLPDDSGLRPTADSPHACFYCKSPIGSSHCDNCVCVSKLVQYEVRNVKDEIVGTWENYEPHHWSSVDCEFARNEASWCANSAMDEIKWTDNGRTKRIIGELTDAEGCACAIIEFRFVEVLDDGPFIERPECQTTS